MRETKSELELLKAIGFVQQAIECCDTIIDNNCTMLYWETANNMTEYRDDLIEIREKFLR